MSMEEKLKEYRALRRRKELYENTKAKLEETKEKVIKFITPKFLADMGKDEEVLLMESEGDVGQETVKAEPMIEQCYAEISDQEYITEDIREESWKYSITKWSIYAIVWLTLFAIFLKLQFGAVFFVISALLGIYFNTRTRPRRTGEVSAYSVFNQNCVSIDGTLKAEQFEREIRFGPGSVR